MFSSIPVPFQAILWPLAGAAVILALRRLMPNWLRRILALVAALLALAVLWSLRPGAAGTVEIPWEPLNIFRLSPALHLDGLSLLAGLTLTAATAALTLGIRGPEPRETAWPGLILVVLAGCLAVVMAANLLTLALGSALLDLALITSILLTRNSRDPGGPSLGLALPGMGSTFLLFLATLQLDTQLGHASLLARELPSGILLLVGGAGLLRALVFPLHPRRLDTAQRAATMLLPVGAGLYLLIRVQHLTPVLSGRPWPQVVFGIALLVGALLAWVGSLPRASGDDPASTFPRLWSGLLVQQTALALAFLLFLPGAAPLPLPALVLGLGVLAVWWDGTAEKGMFPRPVWVDRSLQRIGSWWAGVRSNAAARWPALRRWPGSPLRQYGPILLPAVALASLAGAPLTAGARGRWFLYAALLKDGSSSLLLLLAADTFLIAALWAALTLTLGQLPDRRPAGPSLMAMTALVLLLLAWGIAPAGLVSSLSLKPVSLSGVSAWGSGLLFILPWLLGTWLARVRVHLPADVGLLYGLANLDWFYRAAGWTAQRLMAAVHWLGRVGEGEGWWGWVLVILSLGFIFFAIR